MKKVLLVLFLLINSFSNSFSQSKNTLELLQGYWYLSKDDNVSFIIKGHSYIYFEDKEKYKISIKNNFIELRFENGKLISKYKILKLTNKVLWEKTENGNIVKYIKLH